MVNGSSGDESSRKGRVLDADELPGSTAAAQRAFAEENLVEAADELERCADDDALLTQLRVAEDIECIGRTVRGLGEILVKQELASPFSPAAQLGELLLSRVESSLARIRESAGEVPPVTPAPDRLAPPEPCSTPEEVEHFLASRAGPTQAVLVAPFGASGLHLVELDHRGYDIWWSSCFFAVRSGRNPRMARLLVRLQNAWEFLRGPGRTRLLRQARGAAAQYAPVWLRALLKPWVSRASRPYQVGTPTRTFLGVRTARTCLELHGMLPSRRSSMRRS